MESIAQKMFQATTERGKKAHLVYINAYEIKILV